MSILHLEDDAADHELIAAALASDGMVCQFRQVASKADFIAVLNQRGFDLILADYNLPGFDGGAALALAFERCPEVPFIFVSGWIGEERALESLKTGATDYVFKHNLARLAPAVRRALHESAVRAAHQQAQAALLKSEATLRGFFDTAPFLMGIVEVLADDCRVLNGNVASARLFGASPSALRNRLFSELGLARPAIDEWLRRFREAKSAGQPVQFEFTHTVEGRPQFLSVTVSELKAADVTTVRCCYVAEDVTAKKQLEQQFFRAQRMESIGTLAGGIAHDLNNVLAPILMSLRMLRPKLGDPEDQQLLNHVEASARRGSDIVKQVLTFARGAGGERHSVDFRTLVGDLERILRDTFPRSIRLETRVPSDLYSVTGDTTQIFQVLMNLCVNARDAMTNGGVLLVGIENVPLGEPMPHLYGEHKNVPYVRLRVEDTGVGVPAQNIEKIFDPFFSTKEVGQGTGLGLSTVLSIAKAHGGLVNVISEVGRGTEMQVYLPAELVAPPAPLPPVPHEVMLGHGQCVLVVDDEATVRLVMKKVLEDSGYQVLQATDGAEALTLFTHHQHRINAVITDMMMPVMDGTDTIRALRQLDSTMPIVAASGLMDEHGPAHPAGMERVVFLQKPFNAEELLIALRGALVGGNGS